MQVQIAKYLLWFICVSIHRCKPKEIYTSNTLIRKLYDLKKTDIIEQNKLRNAECEYIFISFDTKNCTCKKKMAEIINTIFSNYKHELYSKYTYFCDFFMYNKPHNMSKYFLINFFQYIASCQLNANRDKFNSEDINFKTDIAYQRDFVDMSSKFLVENMNKAYFSMLISNCLHDENDFCLAYNVFKQSKLMNNLYSNQFNCFFVFKTPKNDVTTDIFVHDINKNMVFTNKEKQNLKLHYSQINLNTLSSINDLGIYNVGYDVWHNHYNTEPIRQSIINLYFHTESNFTDTIIFNYRVKFDITTVDKISSSLYCNKNIVDTENALVIYCRTLLLEQTFILVFNKSTYRNMKKHIKNVDDKHIIESISIYFEQKNKFILYGRFYVIFDEKNIINITQHNFSAAWRLSFNKGQSMLNKFLVNLRTYLELKFCMVSSFFPMSNNTLINYNGFFCHYDTKYNLCVSSDKFHDAWAFFINLKEKLRSKQFEFDLSFFETEMNQKMNPTDFMDVHARFYKRFKIKTLIKKIITKDYFNTLQTITISIKSKAFLTNQFIYLTIPINDHIMTKKIHLLHTMYAEFYSNQFHFRSKSSSLSEPYFLRVMYMIIFNQPACTQCSFLHSLDIKYIFNDERIDFYMIKYFFVYNRSHYDTNKDLFDANDALNNDVCEERMLNTQKLKSMRAKFNKDETYKKSRHLILFILHKFVDFFIKKYKKQQYDINYSMIILTVSNLYADSKELLELCEFLIDFHQKDTIEVP